jgi:hypothetical protein
VKIRLEYSRAPMQDAPERYDNGKGVHSLRRGDLRPSTPFTE